jgi:hypothetical protein
LPRAVKNEDEKVADQLRMPEARQEIRTHLQTKIIGTLSQQALGTHVRLR